MHHQLNFTARIPYSSIALQHWGMPHGLNPMLMPSARAPVQAIMYLALIPPLLSRRALVQHDHTESSQAS
jgi:hypothetical protein